jgi:hypothetical protein
MTSAKVSTSAGGEDAAHTPRSYVFANAPKHTIVAICAEGSAERSRQRDDCPSDNGAATVTFVQQRFIDDVSHSQVLCRAAQCARWPGARNKFVCYTWHGERLAAALSPVRQPQLRFSSVARVCDGCSAVVHERHCYAHITTSEGEQRMSPLATAERRMSAEDAELVRDKRIVVVMPAYNAAQTLELTWRQVPSEWVTSVILVDDASRDETMTVAKALPLEVIHHHHNVGYGGNQKTCYTAALRGDADIVVMLHPDGQYDPSLLPSLVRPILRGEADMVLGSRFLEPGGARAGGMPLYKYLSNRFLTTVESWVLQQPFSELHTGYRAYSGEFLATIPYLRNANDFVFDTQVITQAVHWRQRIVEVPVATKYFPEASSASVRQSLVYGVKTLLTVGRLALHRRRVLRSRLFSD